MKILEIGEFGLIERIKSIVGQPPSEVAVGIDDDAAAFRSSPDRLVLVTTDILIENIHFKMEYFTFYQLGWRSMAANLSDIAAMAGEPEYAFVSMALSESTALESVEELYGGMRDLAAQYNVVVIGGDTTRSNSDIFLNLTIVGSVEPNLIVTRSGACVGDAIYVTGHLGGSLAGVKVLNSAELAGRYKYSSIADRHRMPNPRIQESRFLRANMALHAMIDVSDGLASEVHHICRSSGVGAEVEEAAIPLAAEAREVAAKLGDEATIYALAGGEDFEIVFTALEIEVERIKSKFESKFGIPLTKVGRIVKAKEGVHLITTSGRRIPLHSEGWDHFVRKEV